ncbi:MAG: hypothetical protein QXW35_02520 [Candidatus Aenigmatarchaeota archaeon]
MLPVTFLPDIAASIAATAIIRLIIPKLVKKGVEEAVVKSIDKATNKKVEKKDTEKKEVEVIKRAAVNSSAINTMDENAKINYCVKLAYIYGRHGDEKILEILKERGCIDEEDIEEIEYGVTETRK